MVGRPVPGRWPWALAAILPTMLIRSFLLVGTHFASNSVGGASAFVPSRVPSPTHPSRVATARDGGTRSVVPRSALFARGKGAGGRKVPKMPTLPVSPSPGSASSAAARGGGDSSDGGNGRGFYSTTERGASSAMVVVDVENVRGATSFRSSHEALLSRTRSWREDRLSAVGGSGEAFLEPLVWVCDHGSVPSIHLFPRPNDEGGGVQMPRNFGAMFAGPGRTADDVIVDLVDLRCGGGDSRDDPAPSPAHTSRNTTIVITADARLISRCQQARRRSSSLSDVIFVEPASLLQQLERYRASAEEEEGLFGRSAPGLASPYSYPIGGGRGRIGDEGGRRSDGKTNTMTSFKGSSIAMQQHAKFQARFQNKKANGSNDEEEDEGDSSNNTKEGGGDLLSEQSELEANVEKNNSNAAALAAQLKTEQIRRQLLLSDAYYLARPSKNIRGRRTAAAVHARYKNRNISKKQQKRLYAKRFGRKRREDMADAATRRKELAGRLQMNLRRVETDGCDEKDVVFEDEGEVGMVSRSMELLRTLLRRFDDERSLSLGRTMESSNHESGRQSSTYSGPTAILGLGGGAGAIGTDDIWDPLGKTLNVPLREESPDVEETLPPLRIVAISDTHGFEGGLSRFPDPSVSRHRDDDGSPQEEEVHQARVHGDGDLLPRADVLLHCGDFAASGSRKSQRAAARRLDEFLARQAHIPEKIVIAGNHDPESPARVLFPSSKALYVRSPSTLTVNGVSFALEPFSRRTAYRGVRRGASTYAMSLLPECDVLVTHEPPKGVLDMTYHGFSAGSSYLRELVEHSERKPRLWLCGHIHESRGVTTKCFRPGGGPDGGKSGGDDEESTVVINASNANSGKANRVVSGAVVVDIERRMTGGDTAEGTLQSRKIEDYCTLNEVNGMGSDALSGLEIHVTRPGVRRRKGVPMSVRQQMKQVRLGLVETGSNSAVKNSTAVPKMGPPRR